MSAGFAGAVLQGTHPRYAARSAVVDYGGGVHIGFRSSGGRGEYEVVGTHGTLHASEVDGWTIAWELPGLGRREANLWVDPADSGKARLRATEHGQPQIGRQAASLLLLPDPTRQREGLGLGEPIARAKLYHVTRVGLRPDSDTNPRAQEIAVRPAYVQVANGDCGEDIGFDARWARVRAMHAHADLLPGALAQIVKTHAAAIELPASVGKAVIDSVARLMDALPQFEHGYDGQRDPLPYLEKLAGLETVSGENLPPPTDIDADETEIRVRAATERRLALARGASAAQFSLAVRRAYRHSCVFCGLRLGGVSGIQSGVDAAHILAWSSYDLDVVPNGLCLCKTHHWAFDSGVMLLVYSDGLYRVTLSGLADRFESQTLGELRRHVGPVEERRLPSDLGQHPSPAYLARLYADVPLLSAS